MLTTTPAPASASSLRAATAALALTALLVGCAGAAGPIDAPTAAPTPSESPSATPIESASETPAPGAGVIDTTGWLDFATDDGSIAFRYPTDWTLDAQSERLAPDEGRDDAEPWERWMDSATLTAPNGQQLLQMHDFMDIGGACGDDVAPLEVLASEPFEAQGLSGESSAIATVALGTSDDRWRVGVGITDEAALPDEACKVYFVFSSSDGGVGMGTHLQLDASGEDTLWTVDSLDDARAYMETDEYATILEILRSVEVS